MPNEVISKTPESFAKKAATDSTTEKNIVTFDPRTVFGDFEISDVDWFPAISEESNVAKSRPKAHIPHIPRIHIPIEEIALK